MNSLALFSRVGVIGGEVVVSSLSRLRWAWLGQDVDETMCSGKLFVGLLLADGLLGDWFDGSGPLALCGGNFDVVAASEHLLVEMGGCDSCWPTKMCSKALKVGWK